MTGHRFHVGLDLALLRDDESGIEMEGHARLRPGRVVRISGVDRAGHLGRLAVVTKWRMVRVGAQGPFYRGYCEWVRSARELTTRG